ncbi:hypothetical protein VaNZ11_016653 [Volvox africanus]|uniref:Transmembrane protein n=1 Tax=Volvox africanus TaxID=51714 RepID=A0ABQ5SP52_9CHLO|nr:hypothetical protein VaNZ11_016653 [Volvox africanus]
MQISSLRERICRGSAFRGHLIQSGSRISIVAHAKRKGVSKELRELQQLKEGTTPPATAAPSGPTPAAPTFAVPPTAQQSTVLASPPPLPASTQTPLTVSASASATPATTGATINSSGSSNSSSSSGSSSGLLDNLLIRILASVAAIMAVISVFYSIVFYGASNAVYVFKDQLAAITKKDFVPYSERRRLEQEVLAKLEAEQAERLKGRGGSGEEGVPGVSTDTAATPGVAAVEDGGSSTELLNLLPSSSKK